jgi:hypothetical protein
MPEPYRLAFKIFSRPRTRPAIAVIFAENPNIMGEFKINHLTIILQPKLQWGSREAKT